MVMQYLLAQLIPYDGSADTPPPPAQRPMSFSDFQNGMKQWNDGVTDNTFRNGLLVVVAIVVLISLAVHLRQRMTHRPELTSPKRLGWELARVVPFPFGTRLLLYWVACSTRMPMAALLLSAPAFEASVKTWASHGTFAPLRHWGAGQMGKLKAVLFEHAGSAS